MVLSSHPPIVIEISVNLHNSTSYHYHSYRKYALGDYIFLFRFLSNYDWSCLRSDNIVDAAANSLTNVIRTAADLAIPRGSIRNSRFPP